MKTQYTYEQAVKFLEESGISCDPASTVEGEYVCDLLDQLYDEYNVDLDEYYYYSDTLQKIVKLAKKYLKRYRSYT